MQENDNKDTKNKTATATTDNDTTAVNGDNSYVSTFPTSIADNIKVGDKVIKKDGKKGKITKIIAVVFTVVYEDGTAELFDKRFSAPDFYLIGRTVYGNKITTEELQEEIANQREVANQEVAKLTQLRKQLFTLENLMRSDWKEVLNGKKKARNTAKTGESITDEEFIEKRDKIAQDFIDELTRS